MAVLPIRIWDDPVLSVVCDKLDDNEFGPKLEDFGRELTATMVDRSGYGLAAPQVGVAKRLFVMTFPDHEDLKPVVMCNPELKLNGRTLYEREGCLSLPNIFEQVSRAENVVIQYRDVLGLNHEFNLSRMDARVAQHEFDHLNGIMFFNYQDKRDGWLDSNKRPYGPRMSKQTSKALLREWDKKKPR
jgi:peptide deformylase